MCKKYEKCSFSSSTVAAFIFSLLISNIYTLGKSPKCRKSNQNYKSDCNGTETHNCLVHKQTPNQLAKLVCSKQGE